MADNLEYTTTNAAGNSWVDTTPGAVSTGYQAQNTTIEAAYNGLDNSYVYYDSGTDEIVIPPSGPIDNNGVLVSVKTEVRLTVASAGDWYLRIVPGTTSTVFDVELTSDKGTWDASKNALYDTSGYRVLNWEIYNDGYFSSISRNSSNGEKIGSSESPDFPYGFVSYKYVYPLLWTLYDTSFSSPTGVGGIRGVDYDIDNGNLLSCDGGTNKIYVHDGIASSFSISFDAPATSVSDIVYDRSTGNLISVDNLSDTIYVHDGISSTILTSFATPGFQVHGLTIDISTWNLISSSTNSGLVYIHDGISASVLSSFDPGINYYGVFYDTFSGNLIGCGTDGTVNVHRGISSDIRYHSNAQAGSQGLVFVEKIGKLVISNGTEGKIYLHG